MHPCEVCSTSWLIGRGYDRRCAWDCARDWCRLLGPPSGLYDLRLDNDIIDYTESAGRLLCDFAGGSFLLLGGDETVKLHDPSRRSDTDLRELVHGRVLQTFGYAIADVSVIGNLSWCPTAFSSLFVARP